MLHIHTCFVFYSRTHDLTACSVWVPNTATHQSASRQISGTSSGRSELHNHLLNHHHDHHQEYNARAAIRRVRVAQLRIWTSPLSPSSLAPRPSSRRSSSFMTSYSRYVALALSYICAQLLGTENKQKLTYAPSLACDCRFVTTTHFHKFSTLDSERYTSWQLILGGFFFEITKGRPR